MPCAESRRLRSIVPRTTGRQSVGLTSVNRNVGSITSAVCNVMWLILRVVSPSVIVDGGVPIGLGNILRSMVIMTIVSSKFPISVSTITSVNLKSVALVVETTARLTIRNAMTRPPLLCNLK